MPRSSMVGWAMLIGLGSAVAAADDCRLRSGATVTPVIELYTSEGCSSCPPADRWLSALRPSAAVLQAFHVGYWDHIGWVDRFADPLHTARQRELALANRLSNIYTPQVLLNGVDRPRWHRAGEAVAAATPARVQLELQRRADGRFEARVQPAADLGAWQAYWTVTEDGHATRVRAGENAGAQLRHDAVVRQYLPAGTHRGAQTLELQARPAAPGHARRVNLVVSEPGSARVLQALSLAC